MVGKIYKSFIKDALLYIKSCFSHDESCQKRIFFVWKSWLFLLLSPPSLKCSFLESNKLCICARSPVNPVVPNELACRGPFTGNQWQLHSSACDCNDQRANCSEGNLTLCNELMGERCTVTRLKSTAEIISASRTSQITKIRNKSKRSCWLFGLLVAQAPSGAVPQWGEAQTVGDREREGGVWKEAGTIKITFPFAALWNEMAIPGVCGGSRWGEEGNEVLKHLISPSNKPPSSPPLKSTVGGGVEGSRWGLTPELAAKMIHTCTTQISVFFSLSRSFPVDAFQMHEVKLSQQVHNSQFVQDFVSCLVDW